MSLKQRTLALAISLGLIVAIAMVYARVGGHEFVSIDDPEYVTENPVVRSGLSSQGLRYALSGPHGSNWHPLTTLSHMLDSQLFGTGPGSAGRHALVNVGLHALGAVLLFAALRSLTGALWPAALVAGLFALHPLHVESVAWVSERKDVLSGVFFMTTLLAYGRWTRRPSAAGYLAVASSLALGLMSKPMLVTLPCVLLLLDVWPLERWRRADGSRRAWVGLWVEKLPLFLLSAAAGVATLLAQSAGRSVPEQTFSIGWRLLNAPLAYIWYLWKTLWPSGLAFFYPHPASVGGAELSAWWVPALGASALLIAITAGALLLALRRPYLAVGWLWFLGMLVPVIGLLQVGLQARADRYSYLPMIGIYLALAWSLRDWVRSRPELRTEIVGGAAIALVLCGLVAVGQVDPWRDSRALFERALDATGPNYKAHAGLGGLDFAAGDLAAAQSHFERALRSRPDDSALHNQLGGVHYSMGRPDRALPHFERAVELDPDSPTAHSNLGNVRFARGNLEAARDHYEHALALDPDGAYVHNNLGQVLDREGDAIGARLAFRRAIELEPNFILPHYNLARIAERDGRWAAAMEGYARTLELAPGYEPARTGLTRARARLGRRSPSSDAP